MLEWIVIFAVGMGAALVGLFSAYTTGKSSGKDEERAKNAKERAAELDRIRRASDARPTGGVSDDPYNRDNN